MCGPGRAGSDEAGPGSVGPGCTGPGWAGSDWAGSEWADIGNRLGAQAEVSVPGVAELSFPVAVIGFTGGTRS